jgi:hypothetical protein
MDNAERNVTGREVGGAEERSDSTVREIFRDFSRASSCAASRFRRALHVCIGIHRFVQFSTLREDFAEK